MSYYFSTIINSTFPNAIDTAVEALKSQEFGIVSEIDVTATFRNN